MNIDFHKNFIKNYRRLDLKLRKRVDATIKKFRTNPFNPILKNHALKGKLKGKRAFSITGDCRVIFEEYDNYVLVIMVDIGTHNQVY
jgi:addiction module RelE/StbE family toxin